MKNATFEINAGYMAGQNKYSRLKEKKKTIEKKAQFSACKASWKVDYEINSRNYNTGEEDDSYSD